MIFFLFYLAFQALLLLGVLALLGASLGALLAKLLKALQRHGVGAWLFAPFRAWTGMDEIRRPKP